MKYVIISSGFNCLEYAKKCYKSLCKLDFDSNKWEAWLISDGSTDGTSDFVNSIVHPNIYGTSLKENHGAAYARHKTIHDIHIDDEDVIILLGLDDEIFPNALNEIDAQYRLGKWMTYGNWIDNKGIMLKDSGFNLEFSNEIHEARDYRKDIYRSTALNTFKYFLYKEIHESDLQLNGSWIVSTTESEVMFSCLEMCGRDRIGIIHEPIMLYNKHKITNSVNRNGLSKRFVRGSGRAYKNAIYQQVIKRGKRDLLKR